MTLDEVVAVVLDLAAQVAGIRAAPGSGESTPLAEDGFWLESVGLLELVVACEERFQVTFEPDTDLTTDSLATVGSLARVVHRRLPR
jgi:acyl carrier protein